MCDRLIMKGYLEMKTEINQRVLGAIPERIVAFIH